MSRPRVLLIEPLYHPAGEELLRSHCDVTVLRDVAPAAITEAARSAHAICTRYPNFVGGPLLDVARDVVIVASSGRGTDAIDIEAATARGVVVVNNPGFGPRPVTNQAIAFMLALARRLIAVDRVMRTGEGWRERIFDSYLELEDKTLGVVGLGAIGSEMTRKCVAAFGMSVLAYDPYVPASKAEALGAKMVDSLDELLEASDFVSMHPELNDTTRGMIGEPQLRRMKRGAFLINTARGKVVREAALVRALKEGWIAGAALDVYEDEPLGPGNPLYACDNLILSPHVGGSSVEAGHGLSMSAARQMLQALAGVRPDNVLNPAAWEQACARARPLAFALPTLGS